MLEIIFNRLQSSNRFVQVAVCESVDAIVGLATALDDGAVFIVPFRERAEPNSLATGGHRQRVTVQFAIGMLSRRHDDPRGAVRAVSFDAMKKRLEDLLAGWEPAGAAPFELVGGEASGLGDGVSIFLQTWQSSRFLTGA